MSYIEILLISIGLAADAFVVAICKGISCKNIKVNSCLKVGLYFGLFQAIMPVIGYYVGNSVRDLFFQLDHYVVFTLLVVIGANMIYDAFINKDKQLDDDFNFKSLIVPALATSCDALSVGVSFAFFEVNLLLSILVIGIITFCLSSIGTFIGSNFGNKNKEKAKIFGGFILIIIGVKILLENL